MIDHIYLLLLLLIQFKLYKVKVRLFYRSIMYMNTFIILICMINGNKGVCVYVFTKYSFYILLSLSK